jgi:hypothetical protein
LVDKADFYDQFQRMEPIQQKKLIVPQAIFVKMYHFALELIVEIG